MKGEIVIRNFETSHAISFLDASHAILNGKEYQFDAVMVAEDQISLVLDNSVYLVDISRLDPENPAGELEVTVKGRRFRLCPEDRRTQLLRSIQKTKPARADEASLLAPMPGLVNRILVAPGTRLGAGAGVLILEAMKMENEIRCPSNGTIKEFRVTQGQTVEKNQLLAVVSIDSQ